MQHASCLVFTDFSSSKSSTTTSQTLKEKCLHKAIHFLACSKIPPTEELHSNIPVVFFSNFLLKKCSRATRQDMEKTLENEAHPQKPLQKTTTLHKKSRELSRPTSSCSNLPFRESLCPELQLKISTIDNDQTFLPRKLTTA